MPSLKSKDVAGGYTKTKEDLEKIKADMNSFLLSGDGVFHTIQGEGPFVGYPTTFVRLHWCNLKCEWCDSWYTWRDDTEEYYSEPTKIAIDDMTRAILDAQKDKGMVDIVCPTVVFTGGEPLIQQRKIVNWHKNNPAFQMMIETNGTVMPHEYIAENAYISCSPKLKSSGKYNTDHLNITQNKKVLQYIANANDYNTFKFVCSTEEDLEEVLALVKDFELPFDRVTIMPEGVSKEENENAFSKLMPRILAEGLRVTPRYHNVMFDGAKRRV